MHKERVITCEPADATTIWSIWSSSELPPPPFLRSRRFRKRCFTVTEAAIESADPTHSDNVQRNHVYDLRQLILTGYDEICSQHILHLLIPVASFASGFDVREEIVSRSLD
ncbi:hypothetical protein KIW84_042293 [Lathyrus oleraceus]|uniref:Uncharacterized protein n=1 Tax=Pisum sativum TaxID=3888 RepID=A0A9D5ASW0_PEA|nr:hypothetical protein KIW84_042286 [Pisum sativum]KAI5417624.1 hypothetical protein KIW84_042293 [Pisum sativum]